MKNRLKQFFSISKPSFDSTINRGCKISLDELIQIKQQANEINLLNHKRVMTNRVGGYLSRFKGRGIDFEEVRTYQPGDDVRLIDWRVTARSGKPFTKIFHEERERPVFVIVDLNSSMFFGTKVAFKSVIAAKIAALIAWSAVKSGDRVGGFVYDGENCFETRPKSRTHGILPLLKILSETTQKIPSQKRQNLGQILLKLRNVARPGSLIFIISDFIELDDASEKHLALLSKHNQIVASFVYDPLEENPPPANHYSISDGINRAGMDTRSANFCRSYREIFKKRLSKIREITNRYQIPLLCFRTSDAIVKVLKKGLLEA